MSKRTNRAPKAPVIDETLETTEETTEQTTEEIEAEIKKLEAEAEAASNELAEAGGTEPEKENGEKKESKERAVSQDLLKDYGAAREIWDELCKKLEDGGYGLDMKTEGNKKNKEVATYDKYVRDEDNVLKNRAPIVSIWKAAKGKEHLGTSFQVNIQIHDSGGFDMVKDEMEAIGRPWKYGARNVQYIVREDIDDVVGIVDTVYEEMTKKIMTERAAKAKADKDAKAEAAAKKKAEKEAAKTEKEEGGAAATA